MRGIKKYIDTLPQTMLYYHYSEQVKDLKNTAAMFSTRKEFCSGARAVPVGVGA